MIRRHISVALMGLLALAVSACSAADEQAPATAPASASVTQTAPSVWSAPESFVTPQPSTTGTDSAGSTLPGLTPACSEAIRAQVAINDFFSKALQGPHEAAPAESAAPAPATTSSSAQPTPASTTADDAVAGVTTEDAEALFNSLAQSIPPALVPPLTELQKAAESIVGQPVVDIPAILDGEAVTHAMTAFKDYIADCEPESTT